jgi:excisionase family DNA binding protein
VFDRTPRDVAEHQKAEEGVEVERLTEDDVLLTFKEAEAFLRVSRATVYRLLWSGQLIGHKVGKGWRFYKADLRNLVMNGASGTIVGVTTAAGIED